MSKTTTIRAFPEDIEYFDSLVNDRDIQNRPQAIKSVIAKAEAYDRALSNDTDDGK